MNLSMDMGHEDMIKVGIESSARVWMWVWTTSAPITVFFYCQPETTFIGL